jgi:hypothetical protein
MGWGPVPRGRAARARFVRAHRRSVQRWLDDLAAAGLVEHEPERDAGGRWWRTQIVLLAAPAPTAAELAVTKRRARRWRVRERARRRRPRRAPSLGTIRARSGVPSPRTQARIVLDRRMRTHEARRRDLVESQIAAATERRDLAHPFGAPPSSALSLTASSRSQTIGAAGGTSSARRSARTKTDDERVAGETGARGRAARLAEVRRAAAARAELLEPQVRTRVGEVARWPAGRRCPLGRLREAWVVHRYGLAKAVDAGGALAGAVPPDLAVRVGRAIALYETFADARPPGWPRGGAAALCGLAGQRRADVMAGDVARLLVLAKGMRAAALLVDAKRLDRARARAAARHAPSAGRLVFRVVRRLPRIETAEARRRRVRDAVLLIGRDPAAWPNAELALETLPIVPRSDLVGPDRCEELDGVGARAARYRNELEQGRWRLRCE